MSFLPDSVRRFWRHVELNLREGGMRQVIHKVFWRAGQWIRSESDYLVYRLDAASYPRTPSLNLTERALSDVELERLGYFKSLLFPESMRDRVASGMVCHGFFAGDELANVGWVTSGYLELEPGERIYEDSSAGIFDCFTVPAHRSKGIYTDALVRMIHGARGDGARTVLIAVAPDNYASIKAIERAGFEPHQRITLGRRFGARVRVERAFSSGR